MSNYSPLCRWLGVFVVLASIATAGAAPTANNKKPGAAAAAAAPEIAHSTFTIPSNPKEGKDPFFPDRLIAGPPPGHKNNKMVIITKLTLNGLSGTREKPLAIINNRTMEKGEEAEVPSGGGRVRIRCVDIREDSVVVEVGGQRQELRLRQGA